MVLDSISWYDEGVLFVSSDRSKVSETGSGSRLACSELSELHENDRGRVNSCQLGGRSLGRRPRKNILKWPISHLAILPTMMEVQPPSIDFEPEDLTWGDSIRVVKICVALQLVTHRL